MPSTVRLLQRLQRTFVLFLRPAEVPLDKKDINLIERSSVLPVVFLPGQMPPLQECAGEDNLHRWREQQLHSRAGPWQTK